MRNIVRFEIKIPFYQYLIIGIFLCCLTPFLSIAGDNDFSIKSNAKSFPIIHKGTLTNPYEGLIVGNGDLAMSAQVFSHELVLKLGKNDVWDSRISTKTKDAVLKHDKLLSSNGEGDEVNDNFAYGSINYLRSTKQGPTPKPVGHIKIRHPGLSNTIINSKIDISTGTLHVEYGFPEGELFIESFIHRDKNVVLTKLTAKGKIPWFNIFLEKTPDFADGEMPLPVASKGSGNDQWAISQLIPEKYGTPDFSWHLAATFPEASNGATLGNVMKWPYAIQQDVELEDGASIVFAVGVATDRDGTGNSLNRAFDLAGNSNNERYLQEKSSHAGAWNTFWQASAIELEDKELEALWYQSMFGFACHLKPGAQAPGLNANIPIYDYTGWNGAYTWNHNVQKWYFPSFPVNHPEWYEILADLVKQNLPVFENQAKLIFGLDGAYIDIMTIPFAPVQRASKSHPVFGRALSHAGWISAMLYQHYEFSNDADWLRENSYELISKTADFYSNYLDKYQGEDGVIYPSMLLEDTKKWEPNFQKSKNVLMDLIFFKKTFEIAIEASEILKVDADKRKKWKLHLKNVPEVEYGWKDGQGWYAIYKDWDKIWPNFQEYLHHIRTSRWGCTGWPVFPGEYVQGDEKEGLAKAVRDVMNGVDLQNLTDHSRYLGTFHGEPTFLSIIRLGLIGKFEDLKTLLLSHRFPSGQFSPFSTGENVYVRSAPVATWRIVENQYFPILGITEMLLQSQGGAIRLFPFWTLEKAASFQGLLARGGFQISAKLDKLEGISAEIKSLNGNPCRIKWEKNYMPVLTCKGKKVNYLFEKGEIRFKTEKGLIYFLKEGK